MSHKTIHKNCCKQCPSNNNKIKGIVDSESDEIKTYPKNVIAKEFLFDCYMRKGKFCKGLCDFMEIDQTYLDLNINHTANSKQ